jgi:hypothetical protein
VFPANIADCEEQVDHNAIHSFVLVDVGIAMAKICVLVPLLQSVACVAMLVVIVPTLGEVVVVE